MAHDIPAADTRQTFLREVNLTPLPEVLARWQQFVENWRDNVVPHVDQVLGYAKTHGGEPPHEYADDGGTEDFLDQQRENTAKRQTKTSF
ncbi:hypothetical protein [Streptomyces venezuelae]|uniref:hypothetical protein n=1 Tax=Streptomyces venezuelae TaxID=54571 RepID=UPI003661D6A4